MNARVCSTTRTIEHSSFKVPASNTMSLTILILKETEGFDEFNNLPEVVFGYSKKLLKNLNSR